MYVKVLSLLTVTVPPFVVVMLVPNVPVAFGDTTGVTGSVIEVTELSGLSVIGVVPDAVALVDARREILAALGCDPDHLDDRLLELDMTASDLDELITGEATILRLERWLTAAAKYSNATVPFLNELRLAGRYEEVRRQAGMFDRLAQGSPANELTIPMAQLIGLQASITHDEAPEAAPFGSADCHWLATFWANGHDVLLLTYKPPPQSPVNSPPGDECRRGGWT